MTRATQRLRLVAILALLLMVLPAANAAAIGEWFSTKAQENQGEFELEGPAGRFIIKDIDGESAATYREVLLQGSQIRIEIDRFAEEYATPVSVSGLANRSTEVVYEGPARITTSAVRAPYKMWAQVEESYASLATSSASMVERKEPVNDAYLSTSATNRQVKTLDEAGSVVLASDTGQMRADGAFWASFWEWDLIVETPTDSFVIWTGQRTDPPLGLGPGYGGPVEYQEAFVFVENGSLEAEWQPEDRWGLRIWPEQGSVEGNVNFLAGGNEGNQSFEGAYDIMYDVPDRGDSFQARLLLAEPPIGPPPPGVDAEPVVEKPDGDGSPAVAPQDNAAPAPEPGASPYLWSAVPILAGLLLLALLPSWRRRRVVARLESAHERGDHDYVIEHSHKVLKHKRYAKEAVPWHCLALLHTDGPELAGMFLEWLRPMQEPPKAVGHYLRARIAAAANDWSQAEDQARRSMQEDQAMVATVEAEPSLAPVLRRLFDAANPAYA